MDCGGCIILSLNKSKEGKVFQASVRYANPGPSKFRFLLSRIWLRKRYRFSILFIMFTCSSALIVEYCLSNLMLHKIIVDKVSIARDRLIERPEFMVNKLIVNVDNQILRQKIVENRCENTVPKHYQRIMVWASILGPKIDENRCRNARRAPKL